MVTLKKAQKVTSWNVALPMIIEWGRLFHGQILTFKILSYVRKFELNRLFTQIYKQLIEYIHFKNSKMFA